MKRFHNSLSFAILSLFAVACQKDVSPKPVAEFSYLLESGTATEQVYRFTNTSKYADRFQWNTSTGVATTDRDLLLRFTQNGRNSITLTAKGDGGEDSRTESIDITGIATTGSLVFWSQIGNMGDITVSVNSSYTGKLTRYRVDANAPACGQDGFFTVTLAPGTYTYTAQSQGLVPLKWSGSVTVERGICKSWELRR